MFIAGDLGGTKTLLGLYAKTGTVWHCQREASFKSAAYPSFESILTEFMQGMTQKPAVLCLGVAGPVVDGHSSVTNLSWNLSEQGLAALTGIPGVKLLNDLQAMSLGLLGLPPDRFVDLNPGACAKPGNLAVLAAGTGLGEAILYWDGERHHALATEGGHTDFAPNDPEQDDLLLYLRDRYRGHVSYERILSGMGLIAVYDFLRDTGRVPESPAMRQRRLASDDPAREISQAALENSDALSLRALELFAKIYGAEAGNLALQCFAVGGVMIGGGIAPKILPALSSGAFMQAFCAKGRFADFLQTIPVRVALESGTVLLGAAAWAEQCLTA